MDIHGIYGVLDTSHCILSIVLNMNFPIHQPACSAAPHPAALRLFRSDWWVDLGPRCERPHLPKWREVAVRALLLCFFFWRFFSIIFFECWFISNHFKDAILDASGAYFACFFQAPDFDGLCFHLEWRWALAGFHVPPDKFKGRPWLELNGI